MDKSFKVVTSTRRQFLKATGWSAIGITFLSSCSSIIPALPSTSDPEGEDAFSWFQMLPSGKVRFFCPRMEMGQGTTLGLSQVVAEELNLDLSGVECAKPSTRDVQPFKMTVGSEGITNFWHPVALGAATLREALRTKASEYAVVPVDQVKDSSGGFLLEGGRRVSYKELVLNSPFIVDDEGIFPNQLDLYSLETKRIKKQIGHKAPPPELEAIVRGGEIYSRDFSLPDMLYGKTIKPPSLGGEIEQVNTEKARQVTGVVWIEERPKDNFVGIIARDALSLRQAAELIEISWSTSSIDQEYLSKSLNLSPSIIQQDFEHTLIERKQRSELPEKGDRFISHYSTPFMAHAAMEVRAAVARVAKEKVEVWCGSQDPFFVQSRVAKTLGWSKEDVVVHPLRLGGGFGGKVICQPAEEAAILSRIIGKPVKVEWNREEEFQGNYFQPPFSHKIEASLNTEGRIAFWHHDFISSPIITGPVPNSIAWVVDSIKADEGTARGSLGPYHVENQRVRYSDIRTKVPVGAWRGLGSAPNCFAIESMIDELAHKADIDPLDFRLFNLSDGNRRLANVLTRVGEISLASKFDNQEQSVKIDRGRGLACSIYKDETPVAVVVDVEIDHSRQNIRIVKVYCVQDCGQIINPQQVENQIMGNVVWGCSMTLKEKITFDEGRVLEKNFDSYQILRHDECPEVVMELIASDGPATGVGEAALPPISAAIANAVFNATGERVRALPISYDSLLGG